MENSMKTPRTPTPATLKTRAYGRVERLRQEIAEARASEFARKKKHTDRLDDLQLELDKAQKDLEALSGVPLVKAEEPAS